MGEGQNAKLYGSGPDPFPPPRNKKGKGRLHETRNLQNSLASNIYENSKGYLSHLSLCQHWGYLLSRRSPLLQLEVNSFLYTHKNIYNTIFFY